MYNENNTFKFSHSSEIKESNLIINDKEYKVDLDGNFFDTSNAAIWLFSDRYYVLEKNGIDGELYTSKEYEHTFGNTKDELIKRFPDLLKIPPNDIPDYSKVQKNQLRFFGNLIYAPNGYIFKSTDLRKFFNSCSCYKQNPDFKESDMRKDKKDFIVLMQKYEVKSTTSTQASGY